MYLLAILAVGHVVADRAFGQSWRKVALAGGR
jgi:hypothetical protein